MGWLKAVLVQAPCLDLEARETAAAFAPLSSFETIGWDYRTTAHSPYG